MTTDAPSAPEWFRRALAATPGDGWVEVDGARVHYLCWGEPDRPGLVFVHGGAAHAHWWSFIAPQFARDYRVAAIDLSGHGDSDRRSSYPHEVWTREVMAVADDARCDGPPVVIGHSMGGFVTVATAAAFGDRLGGAIVLDSALRRREPEQEEASRGHAFSNPGVYPDVATALAHFRTVPDQPTSLPYVIDHVARKSLVQVDGNWTWKFDPTVFHLMKGPARDVVKHVKCRLALFRAENGLAPPDIGDFLEEQLGRRAPVIEIPEAYHHLMFDQPLPLVTGLRTLLESWEHSVPRSRRS